MECPKCGFEPVGTPAECPRCGVIFAKIKKADAMEARLSAERGETSTGDRPSALKFLFFPDVSDPNPILIIGRAILLVLLSAWSLRFLSASIASNAVADSFMHGVNLVFHEAGHIIFNPFGRFVGTLGGTLGQLLMPAVCMLALLLHTRDAFGAAVAQWWLAESFMDIAPYINDARALNLVLLGGVTGRDVEDYHDWEFILRKLGLLSLDHALALMAQLTGITLMAAALLWAGINLWRQFGAWRRPAGLSER